MTQNLIIANFRNPTPEWSTASEFPLWSPAGKFPLDHMVIGNQNGNSDKLLAMEKDFFPERVKFWEKLKKDFPKWTTINYKEERDEL